MCKFKRCNYLTSTSGLYSLSIDWASFLPWMAVCPSNIIIKRLARHKPTGSGNQSIPSNGSLYWFATNLAKLEKKNSLPPSTLLCTREMLCRLDTAAKAIGGLPASVFLTSLQIICLHFSIVTQCWAAPVPSIGSSLGAFSPPDGGGGGWGWGGEGGLPPRPPSSVSQSWALPVYFIFSLIKNDFFALFSN